MIIGTMTVYPYYKNLQLSIINRAMFLPVWLIASYTSWYYLIPKYIIEKKYKSFTILLLGLLFSLTILQRILAEFLFLPIFFSGGGKFHNLFDLIFRLGTFTQYFTFIALPVFCSLAIYLAKTWYIESYKSKQIIAQQKEAELNYLKAQINPHFLFNILNNLYGLSLEESKKVPGMILKLSDLLSYTLYESNVDRISIGKELDLIKDFISLEKERYEDRVNVIFSLHPNVDQSKQIAPLLLIPLVENAFKHGVKEAMQGELISINGMMENEKFIFEVKNKISENITLSKNKKHGLGLSNLRRRLDLVYPESHSFTTIKKDGNYISCLKITLG